MIGIVWVILAVVILFTRGNLVQHLLQLIFAIAFLVIGILRLVQWRKQLREFEEENGPGAGEQKPVR